MNGSKVIGIDTTKPCSRTAFDVNRGVASLDTVRHAHYHSIFSTDRSAFRCPSIQRT